MESRVVPVSGKYEIPHEQPMRLGTPFNLAILALFCFFQGIALFAFTVWYVRNWNLAIIYMNFANMINLIPTTYLTVYIGYFGDKFVSQYGRRKPLIIIGIILQILSMFALANPCSQKQEDLFWWLTLWTIVYDCASVTVAMPLRSWMVECSIDDKDFLEVNTLGINGGGIAGGFLGMVLAILIDSHAFACLFCIGAAITTILLIWHVPNHVYRHSNLSYELIPSIKLCMRTRNFQFLFFSKIMSRSGLAINLFCSHLMIFMNFSKFSHYGEAVTYLVKLGILSGIILVVTNVIMSQALKSIDKLTVYKCVLLSSVFVAILNFPASISSNDTYLFIYSLLSVILLVIGGTLTIIEDLFVRDLTVLDTILNDTYRENAYQTVLQLPSGLAVQALSNIPRIILFGTGLIAGTNEVDDDHMKSRFIWNDKVLLEIRIFGSILVALFSFAAFYIIRYYEVNKDVASKLALILEDKKLLKLKTSQDNEALAFDSHNHNQKLILDERNAVFIEKIDNNNSNSIHNATQLFDLRHKAIPEAILQDIVMSFLHFDPNEVNEIRLRGEAAISTISNVITFSLCLAIVSFVCFIAALSKFILHDENSLSVLYLTIILLLSLYILYELLRLRSVRLLKEKLSIIANLDQTQLINAIGIDREYIDNDLSTKLVEIHRCAGDVEIVQQQGEEMKSTEAETNYNKTKRFYIYLNIFQLILIVIAILGITVFSLSDVQPSNHGPTMQPTHVR